MTVSISLPFSLLTGILTTERNRQVQIFNTCIDFMNIFFLSLQYLKFDNKYYKPEEKISVHSINDCVDNICNQ